MYVACYCQLHTRTEQIQGAHGFKLLQMHLILFPNGNTVHEENGKFWPARWNFLCKTVASLDLLHMHCSILSQRLRTWQASHEAMLS